MLKKLSIRKITVTSLSLIIIALLYIFPTNNNELKINETINYYNETEYKNVYLMDKYNYISELKLPLEEKELIEIIKEKIEYLTINGSNENMIPNDFRPIIPINTKILDIKIDNKTLIINFSKELLNINKTNEEKMIEAIIYNVTGLEQIENVKILVDNKPLLKLPNSNKSLPELLSRDFGINKIYEFDNLSGLNKTTIYYVNNLNDEIYYTPVTKINNDDRDKVTIIIEELKSSIIYQSNLSSYLNEAVELNDYEIVEDTIILSFNDKIFDINSKSILEEVEYTISMSLMDNLDVNEVVFKVNNEKITSTTIKTLE